MKSPKDMKIIQIDITNACIHKCSNCTRFCGHHKEPFFMDFPTFQKALDSLKGFPGMIGIMGGEPTLNPDFDRIVRYYAEQTKPSPIMFPFRRPVRDFNGYYMKLLSDTYKERRGLWSALGEKYYQNFELIQDTFAYQCLNDHQNPGLHQALLISRKELEIPDDEWKTLRDQCWIQNEWSAAITPKGAFYCEVAGALDALFDGPGGWQIEPNWWKRTPEQFEDQLHWCELCSAALPVPCNPGNEEMDIISPALLEKLEQKGGSWKVKNQKFYRFDPKTYKMGDYRINHDHQPYISSDDSRISQDTRKSMFPHKIDVLAPDNVSLPANISRISRDAACNMNFQDWLLIVRDASVLNESLLSNLSSLIFNPGIFYSAPNEQFVFLNRRAFSLKGISSFSSVDELKQYYPESHRYIWRDWTAPDVPGFRSKMAFLTESILLFFRTVMKKFQ